MNLFDIIGPVMVGPSSSHTAGAVRIGYVTGKLLGEPPVFARILLHGSFAATGRGHGTDRALVAGLLGMQTDDVRIPDSFSVASKQGVVIEFGTIELSDAHPNSVQIFVRGKEGKELTVVASSLGGGRIKICSLNGIQAGFGAEYPTLIVQNLDIPGIVNEVSKAIAEENVNIAAMQLYRSKRGSEAIMILECDGEVPAHAVQRVKGLSGVLNVTYLTMKEETEPLVE